MSLPAYSDGLDVWGTRPYLRTTMVGLVLPDGLDLGVWTDLLQGVMERTTRLSPVFVFLVLFFSVISASAEEGAFAAIPQRADPWVYHEEGGSYFFTGSIPHYEGIELRCADTLKGLEDAEPVMVWKRHESGPMSWHIWAPELHRLDGKWYIYFAAGQAEDIWKIRMYVLECADEDPLTGTWVERGPIDSGMDSFCLDATVLKYQGSNYLIWAQYPPDIHESRLFIAPLETPWKLADAPVMISRPSYDWERQGYNVNEGPAVLKRNGKVFLSYSGSATNHFYCMGLLWMHEGADPMDPASWQKLPKPVFSTSERTKMYGPGHNSFSKDAEGRDVLIYHARIYKEIEGDPLQDFNRHAWMQYFSWNESGFPVFGEPSPEADAK